MTAISRKFYKMSANILYFTLVPLFYFLFTLAYEPFEITDYLGVGKGYFTENLIFTSLILMAVLLVPSHHGK